MAKPPKSNEPEEEKPESPNKVTLGLRFPPELLKAMRGLARANRRPITTEMEIAFENHLKAAGLWPPASDAK